MTTEMPRVILPKPVRVLRATGALRVCVTGYDHLKNEFIYTTQFRCWHPLSWLLIFFVVQFAAASCYRGCYSETERRSHNG
jgi:hypothetical protein